MLALLNQLVIWDELQENDAEAVIIEGVTFQKSFGPWKAGQEVEVLQLVVDKEDDVWLEECKIDSPEVVQRVKVCLALS